MSSDTDTSTSTTWVSLQLDVQVSSVVIGFVPIRVLSSHVSPSFEPLVLPSHSFSQHSTSSPSLSLACTHSHSHSHTTSLSPLQSAPSSSLSSSAQHTDVPHETTVAELRVLIQRTFHTRSLFFLPLEWSETDKNLFFRSLFRFVDPFTHQLILPSAERDLLARRFLPRVTLVLSDTKQERPSFVSDSPPAMADSHYHSLKAPLMADLKQQASDHSSSVTHSFNALVQAPSQQRDLLLRTPHHLQHGLENDAELLPASSYSVHDDSNEPPSLKYGVADNSEGEQGERDDDGDDDDDDIDVDNNEYDDEDIGTFGEHDNSVKDPFPARNFRERHSRSRSSAYRPRARSFDITRISILGDANRTTSGSARPQQQHARGVHCTKSLLLSSYDSNYDRVKQPVWVVVENASTSDIASIGKHFDLHPLTIEDCQSKNTREKLEIFQHYLFLVFHALDFGDRFVRRRQCRVSNTSIGKEKLYFPANVTIAEEAETDELEQEHSNEQEGAMRTSPIKLIVFPCLVLSFSSSGRYSPVSAVRSRLSRVYKNRLESTAWIIHAVLDCMVDALLPVVDGTVMEVDTLEDLIYVLSGSEHRDLLKRMGLTRRRLSFLRQRLWSQRDVLMSLIGKDWQVFLAGVQIPYLRDVYDHVVTMLHKVEAASELLASLQNTYLANVSIDVAHQSKQSNEMMKNLSAVATIVLPLSLVAGIMVSRLLL